MTADERDAFADIVVSRCDETILLGGGVVPQVKVIRLMTRTPSMSEADFCSWFAASDAAVREHNAVVRHVRNAIRQPATLRDPLRCDVLEEFGFASEGALEQFVAAPHIAVRPDNTRTLVRAFVTNEVILYDIDQSHGEGPDDRF
jgi:hypothetical protein